MELHAVDIFARYIPWKQSVMTKQFSLQYQAVMTDSLLPLVFKFFKIYDRPTLELLVIRRNLKLPLYISPVPDHMVWKKDTFQHSWKHLEVHVFTLIPCCSSG